MSTVDDAASDTFLRGLPKAELHLHIEGTLEPEMMFDLAERNGVELPWSSVESCRAAYAFTSLDDFLALYYRGASVLVTRRDFSDLALAYLRRAAGEENGVRHVEMFFDPQTHTARGVALATVVAGLEDAILAAERECGITSKLIMCFLRHLDEESALATLEEARPVLLAPAAERSIVAVGLDSSEVGNPPQKFARVFEKARTEFGLKCVAHAGEEGPPAYVVQALDVLHVSRLDHGNRILEDPALVVRVARSGLAVTVCPLSNEKLCVVKDMARHPIAAMLTKGLRATVNSDDPAYFGGYIGDNYRALAHRSGLNRGALTELARNSFLGSFLSDEEVARHLAALDAYVASSP
jgi:adenine deaminase